MQPGGEGSATPNPPVTRCRLLRMSVYVVVARAGDEGREVRHNVGGGAGEPMQADTVQRGCHESHFLPRSGQGRGVPPCSLATTALMSALSAPDSRGRLKLTPDEQLSRSTSSMVKQLAGMKLPLLM